MRDLDYQVWNEEDLTDYGDAEGIPYGPRLSSFFLHTTEWRKAFLERLVAVGEPGLLEATARVYDLLADPKDYRSALIAKAAGVSGSGKLAIAKALQAYLDEWLQPLPPLPAAVPGQSLEAWHEAAMQAWSSEQEREQSVVKRFAAALDGKLEGCAMP